MNGTETSPMTKSVSLAVRLGTLELRNPVLAASGTFGYGDEYTSFIDNATIGGFVTKSVTPTARRGNPHPRVAETPAGMLNSIGLENLGIDHFLEHDWEHVREQPCLPIVSVAAYTREDYVSMVAKLQRALVLAISYPEGDPTGGVVTLEGSEVSTAKDLLDDSGPDWKISKLTEQLQIHKNNWKVTHPNESFPGELIMLVDQNVNFKIIKKVMYSAGVAGYTNLLFAVTKKASSEGGGGGGGGH